MVMNADNRIFVFFNQSTHEVIGSFLHFGVGTLYGIQFNAVAVATCIHRRNAATT